MHHETGTEEHVPVHSLPPPVVVPAALEEELGIGRGREHGYEHGYETVSEEHSPEEMEMELHPSFEDYERPVQSLPPWWF